MKNLFDEAMSGIGDKVALQEIRKVVRGKDPEKTKLEKIVSIVTTYLDYAERAELDAERRAIEAEEAEMRREKVNDIFDDIKKPLDKLFDPVTRKDDGK